MINRMKKKRPFYVVFFLNHWIVSPLQVQTENNNHSAVADSSCCEQAGSPAATKPKNTDDYWRTLYSRSTECCINRC